MSGSAENVANWFDEAFGSGGGGVTIQDAGVDQPQRPTVNFVTGAVISDDSANNRTNIAISGYQTVQSAGVALTQRSTVNFIGAYSVTDDSGGARTVIQILPTTPSFALVYDVSTSSWRRPSYDDLTPALAVTLSGGSGGVFECGATWTLSALTASPACNAAGVTLAQLAEIVNGVTGTTINVLAQPNPLSGASLPHTSYTRSGSGDVVDLQLSITQNGVGPRQSSLGSVRGTFYDRYFTCQDTNGAATGATASGNNATLSTSTAMAGVLASGGMAVGTTFSVPASATPKYFYLLCYDNGSTFTWYDIGNNATFNMSRVAGFSFANQFSVAKTFGLYRSDNLLTAAFSVRRAT